MISSQNPQVEGFFQRRRFFDSKIIPPSRRAFDLIINNGKYILQAGRAHGITDGAEFTVYQNKLDAVPPGIPLGAMIAKDAKIWGFSTDLEPLSDIVRKHLVNSRAVAVQTKIGALDDLEIYVPMGDQYLPVFEAIAKEVDGTGPELCRLKVVDSKNEARLGVMVVHETKLAFEVLDSEAKKYGCTRLPKTIDCVVDDIHRVLRSASRYHFHLNNDHMNYQIKEGISIEFLALGEPDADGTRLPIGENMHIAGKVELKLADESKKYGMRLTNNTSWDLHFACFFFEHADLSISTSSFA